MFPDAIHTLRKLSEKCLSDIDVVSLAVFDKQKQNLDIKLVKRYSKAIWHSSAHNTGLMIGRAQWKMIKDCLNVLNSLISIIYMFILLLFFLFI